MKRAAWALSWPVAFTVSLPRLVDLDWRVDIKTSSDSISRMAVPTCLLRMKVRPLRRSWEGDEGPQGLGTPRPHEHQSPSSATSDPLETYAAPPDALCICRGHGHYCTSMLWT